MDKIYSNNTALCVCRTVDRITKRMKSESLIFLKG